MVRRSALLALVATLAASADAQAAGVFVADPPSSAFVEEIRAAVSVDPSGATTWVGARISGAADTVVWIVPRDPHDAVDLSTNAWLDALEDGTAPRVVAPKDAGCEGPAETVGGVDFPPSSAITGKRAIATDAELSTLEADWGITLDAQDRVALSSSLVDGNELVAVRWTPPSGVSASPVLRLRGAGATVPLQLTRADASQAIDVTVSLIADTRATAPFLSLVAIPDTDLRWPGGADSYRAARESLLVSATSARFVLESATDRALTTGEWIAGAGKSPSVADAFVRRAVLRGELQGDVGQLSASLAPALTGAATWSAPCPRGDLFAGATCKDGASVGDGHLGRADDVAFALAGVPKNRWTTRLTGRIAAGARGKAVTLAGANGPTMTVLRRATAHGCATASKPGGSGNVPVNGGGEGPDAGGPQEVPEEGFVETDNQSQSSVDVNVGCDTSSSESCSSDSSSSDSGCSSDSSETDDGCSSDSSEGGDSCSGDSGADDGCSGGEGDGADGCGSSDGGNSGSGCSGDGSSSGGCSSGGAGSDCTVAKGKTRRPSKWVFLGLALAFPLRRWTKKRPAR